MASKMIKAQTGMLVSPNGLYEVTKRKAKRGMEIISIKNLQSNVQGFIKRHSSAGYSVFSNTFSAFPKYVQEAATRL